MNGIKQMVQHMPMCSTTHSQMVNKHLKPYLSPKLQSQ